MYQSAMAKRQGLGSSGIGFGFVLAEIKELLPEKNICLAQDLQTGDQYQVGLNKRGETAWPQLGDKWILDRSMGHWALQSKVTAGSAPAFTGFFNTMDPDVLRLATVLKGLGLIRDATTTGPTPPSNVFTGTRNTMRTDFIALLGLLDTLGVVDDQSTAQTLPVGVWQLVGGSGLPAYTSPWTYYQDPTSGTYRAPRYMISADSVVTVEGLAKTTADVSGAPTIFTLPTGFRPPKSVVFPLISNDNTLRQGEVLSTGVVRLSNVTMSETIAWVTLAMRFTTT